MLAPRGIRWRPPEPLNPCGTHQWLKPVTKRILSAASSWLSRRWRLCWPRIRRLPPITAVLHATGEVRIGSIGLAKSLEHWVNDGLVAIFFVFVGLEIKREFIEGSLADVRKAALPVIAAVGGFVLPAAFYVAVNWGDVEALRGWAVPVATDIAFVVAICAVLGRIVPASSKTFLLALAIIDDLMGNRRDRAVLH